MKHELLLNKVEDFFSQRIVKYGATPAASDYNSREAQEIRFEQLLKLIDNSREFSLNDYGCGYGALAHFMHAKGYKFNYYGFDISEPVINEAKKVMPVDVNWTFFCDSSHLNMADYSIACAIFNNKFEADVDDWELYILDSLRIMSSISGKGFAFNMLTKYSDKEKMRPDLYYGDPLFYFDFCKTTFSRNVALLHDYELYDFTIIVRL